MGEDGFYWSSTLDVEAKDKAEYGRTMAYRLELSMEYGHVLQEFGFRFTGQPIRAVAVHKRKNPTNKKASYGSKDYDFNVNGVYYKRDEIYPQKVTLIGVDKDLTEDITIPEKLKTEWSEYEITDYQKDAFKNCTNIKSIDLSKSTIKELKANTFQNCKSLKLVKLPNNLKVIESGLFEGCSSLEYIELPSSVTRLYGKCFKGCSNLKDIKMPSDLEYAWDTFDDCTQLKGRLITVEKGERCIWIGKRSDCTAITIPSTVTKIGDYAFKDCKELKSIQIPSNVTSIGFNAFCNTGLTSITIPANIQEIKSYAFANSDIKQITFTNSMFTIPNNIFENCKQLTNIDL